jgi:hypothetical protein
VLATAAVYRTRADRSRPGMDSRKSVTQQRQLMNPGVELLPSQSWITGCK